MRVKGLALVASALLAVGVCSFTVAAGPGKIMVIDSVGNAAPSLKLAGVSDFTLVQSEAALKAEMANLASYGLVIFGYHEINATAYTKAWLDANPNALVDWVKKGGAVLSTVRDDPADNSLLTPFGLSYSGTDSQTVGTFDITDKKSPIFTTPNKIDPFVMDEQVADAAAADPTYTDTGLDPANLKVIAVEPDTDLPLIVADSVGAGKVIFCNVEVLSATFAPVAENIKLLANMLDWARK